MGTTTDKRTDDATTDQPTKGATAEDATAKDEPTKGATAEDATAKDEPTKGATAEKRTDDPPAEGGATAAADTAATDATDDASDATDDASDTADEADTPDEPAPSAAAGAGAVVAAGLGLASVTGTWLGTLLAERQTVLGQIKLQSGKVTDQIGAVYGTPWHTTALVNGVFAVLAMLVSAVVLTGRRPTWVRAVAWGGLALGLLGLLISAGMYLDLFASLPSLPKAPGGGA
ncbi:hypothetical protein ACH4YO_04505 [Streptomyces noursei]|uniref:hypothetical protein n=1 Tax=Streptomyces noursei TaxID=1971 RepID=UPI003405181F